MIPAKSFQMRIFHNYRIAAILHKVLVSLLPTAGGIKMGIRFKTGAVPATVSSIGLLTDLIATVGPSNKYQESHNLR